MFHDITKIIITEVYFFVVVGGNTGYIKLTRTVLSWDLPADVDMEDAWYDLAPNEVHGDSKEVHLDICITK